MLNHNKSLIPFLADRKKKYAPRLYGYVDEKTGEIAIEPQYERAGPFIGDFAVVRDIYGKPRIINRDNKRIWVGIFDEAYLYTSENGKTTIAVLEIIEEQTRVAPLLLWWLVILFGGDLTYKEMIFKERLVNLTTGKTIIHQQYDLIHDDIEVFGEYFCVDSKLYRFLDNGNVQCVADDERDRTRAIAILNAYFEQRGINAIVEDRIGMIRVDYSPYIDKMYADPDFTGAFEKLRPDFTIPFQEANGLYRSPRGLLNTPIEITGDRRYRMRFRQEKPSVYADGIYNETKKEWELEPYLVTPDGEMYFMWNIYQTNNPHVFDLRLLKPNGYFIETVIDTVSGKYGQYTASHTNNNSNRYPHKGGVYYYIAEVRD